MKIYPLSERIARFTRSRFRLFGTIAIFTFLLCYVVFHMMNDKNYLTVGLTGVQHMGKNFHVSEFYVDGYSGGNVGREGGGGSDYCCVTLPEKWRPGMVAELRWAVADWSKENKEETAVGNYRSITWKCFKAIVPVEKYDGEPEQLYVHFFAGGLARMVSSGPAPESTAHPIRRNDPHASETATIGTPVPSLFTEVELAEMTRKYYEQKAKYGSWK